MVTRAALLVLLLVGSGARAGDYRLWLTLPDQPPGTIELGRAFNVLLWYQGPADLDGIVTTPWQDAFDIARGYAQHLEDDTQRLRLRLTPRRTGQLALVPLRLGSAQTEATTVAAGPAIEHGAMLDPTWSVSGAQPWQREEIRVSLALAVADPEARVQSDEFHPPGFAVRTVPATREPLADGRTRYRFTWLLRAAGAGDARLLLPRLRYIRDGVPRRRFHFPPLQLSVQPLPPYVTPTVPVGRIEPHPGGDDRLQGLGVAGDTFAGALERAGLPAIVDTRLEHDGGSRTEARIDWRNAAPVPGGLVYFDVMQGKLLNVSPRPPGQGTYWLAVAVALAVLLTAAWRARHIAAAWRRWRYRRSLSRALAATTEPEQQARLLLARPLPGRPERPRTLSGWLSDYGQVYGLEDARLAALQRHVVRLEAARFAGRGAADAPAEAFSKAL